MIVKAKVSFAGLVSMVPGEVRNIDAYIAQDLLRAGYVELITDKYVDKAPAPKKPIAAKKKKK